MSIAPGLSGDRRLPLIMLLIVVILAGISPIAAVAEPTEKAQHHFQAGLQHKKDGDMTKALQELSAAIGEAPEYADAYWARGWVQADLGDKDGACISFNIFLGIAPDDERAAPAREAIGRLGGNVSPAIPSASNTQDAGQDLEATLQIAEDDPEQRQTTDQASDPHMAEEAKQLVAEVQGRVLSHIEYCEGLIRQGQVDESSRLTMAWEMIALGEVEKARLQFEDLSRSSHQLVSCEAHGALAGIARGGAALVPASEFVGDLSASVLHRSTCGRLSDTAPSVLIPMPTANLALRAGYEPCPGCCNDLFPSYQHLQREEDVRARREFMTTRKFTERAVAHSTVAVDEARQGLRAAVSAIVLEEDARTSYGAAGLALYYGGLSPMAVETSLRLSAQGLYAEQEAQRQWAASAAHWRTSDFHARLSDQAMQELDKVQARMDDRERSQQKEYAETRLMPCMVRASELLAAGPVVEALNIICVMPDMISQDLSHYSGAVEAVTGRFVDYVADRSFLLGGEAWSRGDIFGASQYWLNAAAIKPENPAYQPSIDLIEACVLLAESRQRLEEDNWEEALAHYSQVSERVAAPIRSMPTISNMIRDAHKVLHAEAHEQFEQGAIERGLMIWSVCDDLIEGEGVPAELISELVERGESMADGGQPEKTLELYAIIGSSLRSPEQRSQAVEVAEGVFEKAMADEAYDLAKQTLLVLEDLNPTKRAKYEEVMVVAETAPRQLALLDRIAGSCWNGSAQASHLAAIDALPDTSLLMQRLCDTTFEKPEPDLRHLLLAHLSSDEGVAAEARGLWLTNAPEGNVPPDRDRLIREALDAPIDDLARMVQASDDPLLSVCLITRLLDRGRQGDAQSVLASSLSERPGFGPLHLAASHLIFTTNVSPKSIPQESLLEALSHSILAAGLTARSPLVLMQTAALYLALDRPDAALFCLNEVPEPSREHPRWAVLKAIAHLKLGEPQAARASIEQAPDKETYKSSVHFLLACASRLEGDRDTMRSELMRATAADNAYYSVSEARIEDGLLRVLIHVAPPASEVAKAAATSPICSVTPVLPLPDELLMW